MQLTTLLLAQFAKLLLFEKKYLSNTNSTITRIDKSKARTANAPQALDVKSQNFKYLFFIKKTPI